MSDHKKNELETTLESVDTKASLDLDEETRLAQQVSQSVEEDEQKLEASSVDESDKPAFTVRYDEPEAGRFDQLKDKATEAFESLKETVGEKAGAFKDAVVEKASALKEAVSQKAEALGEKASQLKDSACETLSDLKDKATSRLNGEPEPEKK